MYIFKWLMFISHPLSHFQLSLTQGASGWSLVYLSHSEAVPSISLHISQNVLYFPSKILSILTFQSQSLKNHWHQHYKLSKHQVPNQSNSIIIILFDFLNNASVLTDIVIFHLWSKSLSEHKNIKLRHWLAIAPSKVSTHL